MASRDTQPGIEKYGTWPLHDIFTMQDEWERDYAVQSWIDYQEMQDGDQMVKLKTNDGNKLTTCYVVPKSNGKRLEIGPSGRRVRARVATFLMAKHGQTGELSQVDQMTSFSPMSWATFSVEYPERAKALAIVNKSEPHFPTNYLVQDTGDDPVVEEEVV